MSPKNTYRMSECYVCIWTLNYILLTEWNMFLWFFKKKGGDLVDTHAVHAIEQCGKQDLLVQYEHAQECSQWWALQVSDDVLHVVGLCHKLLQSQFPPLHNPFSSTARSSQTSENFPSSMPSPTNQCTKVHLVLRVHPLALVVGLHVVVVENFVDTWVGRNQVKALPVRGGRGACHTKIEWTIWYSWRTPS